MIARFAIVRVALVCLLLTIACTAQAKKLSIYERTDEFKGNTIYFTDNEKPNLDGGSFVSMRYVFVSFMAISPMTDASLAYTIKIEANLPDWMFVSNGESLILKADDQTITLNGPGSLAGREVTNMGVKEVAYYAFPVDTLKKLAAAQNVQFRLYGDKGQITGMFTDRMMQTLRFFAEQAPELIKDPHAAASAWPPTAAPPSPSPTPTAPPAAAFSEPQGTPKP